MVRLLQRLLGVVLLVFGIYLIFGADQFYGVLLIILAFLIFPNVNKGKQRSYSHDYDGRDYHHDSAFDSGGSDGGGDSGGGGGD
ncbi:hypothetical protein [Neobacillus niacini]|uniref:hypothetical protein n=1 Tax=Neobacillus niacini TaxID=86668 RepID=UPI0021CB2440|nr:hypothetical protein [Neobacillus niacini]MCM3763556.1 hypothetical protein [Neobacillus niacini]